MMEMVPCRESLSCGRLLLDVTLPNTTAAFGNSTAIHPVFNFSYQELHEVLSHARQGYLDPTTEIIFIICYVSMIVFGVVGNITVGWVIWRKRSMRTPRNLYIINLTVSDLSMCLVCMPVTLVGLLYKNWGMGELSCKLVPVLQAANIMVSTCTVVAIAVDRYATIVKAGRSSRSRIHVTASIAVIWASCVLLTLPLYFYHIVTQVKIHNILLYSRCIVHWPSRSVRNIWMVALLLTQYGIPMLVLSLVHSGIKRFLGHHHMGHYDARRAQKEIERNRKTTILLSTIAVAFAVSWLPWHVVNMLAEFQYYELWEPRHLYTVLGTSHIIAMTSACLNPVLYGWLNTNLRRELLDVLPSCLGRLSCCQGVGSNRGLAEGRGGEGRGVTTGGVTSGGTDARGEVRGLRGLMEEEEVEVESGTTRQPESVTLLVFQAQTNAIETIPHPPPHLTTTTTTTMTTMERADI